MASHAPAGDSADRREPRRALLAAMVFTAAVLVFAPAIDGPWLFDDHLLIADNSMVHGFTQWTRWFTQSFWETSWVSGVAADGDSGGFWRPFVLASYAFDWTIGGGSPVIFHGTNLLLHGAAAVLAYLALRRWLGGGWPALLAALFWAVHPTKAESVAWITGRPDLLVTLGVLVALAGVAARLERRRWGLPLELCGAALAYGSKEHAVVLPLLVLVEVIAHAGWPRFVAIDRRSLARFVGPQLALALFYLAARQWALPIPTTVAEGGIGDRAGTVLETYGHYTVMTAWPADLSMGSSLIHYAEGSRVVSPLFALAGVALLLALAWMTWRWRARSQLVLAAWLFPLLLVPVGTVVATVNDVLASPRLVYQPHLGIAFLGGVALRARPRAPRHALPLAAVLVALFGARTLWRARDFADAHRLWTYEIEHSPRYLPALEYFVVEELRDGRPRSALRLAAQAFRGAVGTRAEPGAGHVLKHAFEALLILTPDLDRAMLTAFQGFVVDLRAGRSAVLADAQGEPLLSILAGSAAATVLARQPMSLAALEARLASRLGDDARAVALTREVAARCPDCGQQRVLVPVAVRAGQFALAHELVANLERTLGPGVADDVIQYLASAEQRYAQVQAAPPAQRAPLRAWFFVDVGAWGRAYAAAGPVLTAPNLGQPEGTTLAEIACRAGDEQGARELLARWLSPAQMDAQIDAWARQMRWIDAPRPADEPLPEALRADPD